MNNLGMLRKVDLFHYKEANGQRCVPKIKFTSMFAFSSYKRLHALCCTL